MRVFFYVLILIGLVVGPATAQDIPGPGPLKRDDRGAAAIMARIAEDALAAGATTDPEVRLHLQIVAGHLRDAVATLTAIRARQAQTSIALLLTIRWEIFLEAKLAEARGAEFQAAFRNAAAEALLPLSALDAYRVLYSLGTPLGILEQRADDALDAVRAKTNLTGAEVASLMRNWLAADAYRQMAPGLPEIAEADDRRRYNVSLDIPIAMPDGAVICAYVVRPRTLEPLPVLLNFTIYADRRVNLDNARLTAAHGYAAVIGFTRGKACSPDTPEPLDHVGSDADALINWIADQPWSDGRVGMYGGSYEGFAQWAAAKHPPMALRALMPAVSFSPGTDFPMEGGIFVTYALPWPLYTTDNKALDDATYFDAERWARLRRNWYASGRPYRDLSRIDGQANPVFDHWLAHPDFDAYWRGLVPSDDELHALTIPVLTTTGYYDSGQIGALSYLLRHERLNPTAEQYLVIGPYSHQTGQIGTTSVLGSGLPILRGYALDPVAQIDMLALRYQWFDYVMKDGPRPAILQDRVNYEVMGKNIWKHAPAIAGLGGPKKRFYLADNDRLSERPSTGKGINQSLDLADRSKTDQFAPSGNNIDQSGDDWPIVSTAPNLAHARLWRTRPFKTSAEITGLFTARLAFIASKKDFDFAITLFEQTAAGKYQQLSYLWQRASYARNRGRRNLLKPGQTTKIEIAAGRMTARQLQPGSRLVVAISLLKQPGEQINYGTGGPVSDESIADATSPLQVKWLSGSYIAIPVAQ